MLEALGNAQPGYNPGANRITLLDIISIVMSDELVGTDSAAQL
jgi:hypothetical protein